MLTTVGYFFPLASYVYVYPFFGPIIFWCKNLFVELGGVCLFPVKLRPEK